jgi:hypothetical protein
MEHLLYAGIFFCVMEGRHGAVAWRQSLRARSDGDRRESEVFGATIRIAAERLGVAILRNILKKILSVSSPGPGARADTGTQKEVLSYAIGNFRAKPPA